MLHIRPEMPYSNSNLCPLELAQITRQVKQLHSFFKGDGFYALSLLERCELRLHLGVGTTHLHKRSITADLDHYGQTCLRIITQHTFSHLVFQTQR